MATSSSAAADSNRLMNGIVIVFGLLLLLIRNHRTYDVNSKKHPIRVFVDNNDSWVISRSSNFSIFCQFPASGLAWWNFNNSNLTDSQNYQLNETRLENAEQSQLQLRILNANFNNTGLYSCHVRVTSGNDGEREPLIVTEQLAIDIIEPLRIDASSGTIRRKSHENICLFCTINGTDIEEIFWTKTTSSVSAYDRKQFRTGLLPVDFFNTTFCLNELTPKHNGSYECHAKNLYNQTVFATIDLLIVSAPSVDFELAKAVATDAIFIAWLVNDGNDFEQLNFTIKYKKVESNEWILLTKSNKNRNHLLKNLDRDTEYVLAMYGTNSAGAGSTVRFPRNVRTLKNNPVFVPEVTGSTVDSITVKRGNVSDSLLSFIHTFELFVTDQSSNMVTLLTKLAEDENHYLLPQLKPATTYFFKIRACSNYTNECGNWSSVINATTLEGISGPPINLTLSCHFNNATKSGQILANWYPPENPNGKIFDYNVILEGVAKYRDETGKLVTIKDVNIMKKIGANTSTNRFDDVPVNTNYSLKVVVISKSRKHGKNSQASCRIPSTFPDETQLNAVQWESASLSNNKPIFHLTVPRISERNAEICCYRVYVIRLRGAQTTEQLPRPDAMHINTYHEAHKRTNASAESAAAAAAAVKMATPSSDAGETVAAVAAAVAAPLPSESTASATAYLADMFSSRQFQMSLDLGDNKVFESDDDECHLCVRHLNRNDSITIGGGAAASGEPRHRRFAQKTYFAYDGDLDVNANYSGYLEVIYKSSDGLSTNSMFSNYFRVLKPGQQSDQLVISPLMYGMFLQAISLAIFLILILLLSLCLFHRYSKKMGNSQGAELITFRSSFSNICRSLRGRRKLANSWPHETRAILKENLLSFYLEKHRDNDYEFEREFEMLPEKLPNRTTKASEALENLSKNRYPDIKAYDQTRVRLSPIDNEPGSDYINANFVNGYKNRKKFVCAQGPLESTISDFWRMIWEQKIELVLMLTNLEEYCKVKCAKYWPEASEREAVYGDFVVRFCDAKSFADYAVRELRVTRKVPGGSGGHDRIERRIVQFHFTSWKDFHAPDYPSSIVKFIRRVNELYAPDRGAILVHCSAGVGRTGTLVALDSLIQQLHEENAVSVFSTVCELRQQRNLLVQSLKQYIFVYRALLEIILYGNTEIELANLKETYNSLMETDPKTNKCFMEAEFDKILKMDMETKSVSMAMENENCDKNRNDDILPYNINSVILMPTCKNSTYINASFIEGYATPKHFIITQDPIENKTEVDFWRMICDHDVTLFVMLSELGDGYKRCPKYWPDDFGYYGCLTVRLLAVENHPYFVRRDYQVTNNATNKINCVSQFQYNGWPTVDGQVPEVTRGLCDLIDQAAQLCSSMETAAANAGTTGSASGSGGGSSSGSSGSGGLDTESIILVHCHFGTDRSSMFVALCILIHQLKTEKRVDVFNVVRKLRSQRVHLMDTFPQYEFLYRAIINYADLHKLSSDH